jgi:hypothetical protein
MNINEKKYLGTIILITIWTSIDLFFDIPSRLPVFGLVTAIIQFILFVVCCIGLGLTRLKK